MRHFTAAVRSFEFIVINLAPQSTVAIRVLMPSKTSPFLPGSELLIQTSPTLSGTDKVATQYSKGFVSSLYVRCCTVWRRDLKLPSPINCQFIDLQRLARTSNK